MKNLTTAQGIGTDAEYVNGNLVDGATLIDTTILQDIVQFFQKITKKARVIPNNNFDNETNGYQLIEAISQYKSTAYSKKMSAAISGRKSQNGVETKIFYFDTTGFQYIRLLGILVLKSSNTYVIRDFDIKIYNTTETNEPYTIVSEAFLGILIKVYMNRIEILMEYVTEYSLNFDIYAVGLDISMPEEVNIN